MARLKALKGFLGKPGEGSTRTNYVSPGDEFTPADAKREEYLTKAGLAIRLPEEKGADAGKAKKGAKKEAAPANKAEKGAPANKADAAGPTGGPATGPGALASSGAAGLAPRKRIRNRSKASKTPAPA